jgi:hypothetical protein
MGRPKSPFTAALQFEPDWQIFGSLEVLDSYCTFAIISADKKRLTFNHQIGLAPCLFGRCGPRRPRGVALF